MIKENLEAQIIVFLFITYLGLLSIGLRLLVYCVTDNWNDFFLLYFKFTERSSVKYHTLLVLVGVSSKLIV